VLGSALATLLATAELRERRRRAVVSGVGDPLPRRNGVSAAHAEIPDHPVSGPWTGAA
jgi:hypothetical protein